MIPRQHSGYRRYTTLHHTTYPYLLHQASTALFYAVTAPAPVVLNLGVAFRSESSSAPRNSWTSALRTSTTFASNAVTPQSEKDTARSVKDAPRQTVLRMVH